MAVAGTLTYKTELDTSGIQKSGSTVKSIIAGLGITKLISSAMNTIKSSTGDAIKRLDTFNAYPKVLENFGVSADEAQKSISRIDKSVRGLPTSLDQAVGGVQNLFMVTKDLGQAEKLFKAINDSAMVFANGSTEAVDRFSYAFKQAMSSGKVSAQDFNQMNEAIPGLMDKVAESMGINYATLKEGLSDGSISMEQFNDALKKLDTEGGAGMSALEKVARNSTGGIATSITNAKTAVVRGVSELIKGLNDGLAQANLPSINEIITGIGKKAETVLKTIASKLPNIIKFMSNLYKTIVDIAPYLVTIGVMIAAWKVGKTIQSIVQGFQAAKVALSLFTLETNGASIATGVMNGTLKLSEGLVALLTGKMTLAQLAQAGMAKAQAALNAVMSANPIALVVVAIVGLIAAFVLLWNKSEAFRNFWKGLWEGLKKLFEDWVNGFKLMVESLKSVFSLLINWFNTKIQYWVNIFRGVINFITGVFSGNWKQAFNGLKQVASAFINSFLNSFGGLPRRMLSIGLDIVKGIGRGITSGVNWIKNVISSFVGNVTRFIKRMFKIGSPSKLMKDEVGQWLPKGIAVGIEANTDSVENAMKDMYKEMDRTIKMENNKLNIDAISGNIYNKSFYQTPVSIDLNANVEMDSQKVGRLVTPSVTKTIKNGGGI